MKKRALLSDIAQAADTSVSTVSFVLNGRAAEMRISPPMVERIRLAARRLGYVPNLAAKRLRTRSTGREPLILAILTSLETPLSLAGPLMQGVDQVAKESTQDGRPVQITIETFHHRALAELPGLANGTRFNGAIITNTMPEDDAFLASQRPPVPIVLFNRIIPGYSAVLTDEEAVGAQAAQECLSHGQRIGLLRPQHMSQAVRRRHDGFLRALATIGLKHSELVCPGLHAFSPRRVLCEAIDRDFRCDSVYALTGVLAEGAQAAIAIKGVGDRMHLVGESEDHKALFDPHCTGAQQPNLAKGRAAAQRLLLDLAPDPPAPELLVFEGDAVIRREPAPAGDLYPAQEEEPA